MRDRSNLLAWALLMLLSFYMTFIGAAATLEVRFKNVALALGLVASLVWWLGRRRWRWHSTPLDGLALLWLAVIGLSTLANLETWRRSAIGLWYVGMYFGVWLVLYDCVANRALTRSTLVDAILLSSLVPLGFALREVGAFAADALQQAADGFMLPELPRPSGTLGNTNLLAAYLILVIPLGAGRWLTVRQRWQRLALSFYGLVALGLLFLTYSRSNWLGLALAGVLFGVLLLAHHNLLALGRLRAAWQALNSRTKALIGAAFLAVAIFSSVLVVLSVRALNVASRTLDLRTYLFEAAWQAFQEQPLTGSGLFTFGSTLTRFSSVPPRQIHAHAHSAFFNIAAELGLFGLLALAASLVLLVVLLRRQWRTLKGTDRLLFIGAASALGALAVSHMTDFTIFTAIIALTGLVILLVATFPASPLRLTGNRARLNGLAALGLWAALYLSGLWSNAANGDYFAALQEGIGKEDWRASQPHFERAIALDPQLSLYRFYYGHVLGVAAAAGEVEPQVAIAVYETFVRQEPNYAAAWANLAALHWQAGDQDSALTNMQRAADLASKSWLFHYALGAYHEALGDQAAARERFSKSLAAQPVAALYPVWRETALRRDLADATEIPTSIEAVLRLLRDGELDAAASLWRTVRWNERAGLLFLIDAVFALERGDQAQAARDCAQVERVPLDDAARESWRWLCRAYLAHVEGDQAAYAEARQALASYTQKPFDSPIDVLVSPIGYSYYQRMGLSQYLLPQVYNPPLPPSFYALLDHLERFTAKD